MPLPKSLEYRRNTPIHDLQQRGRGNRELGLGQVMALDAAHGCSFAGGYVPEFFQVRMDAKIAQPPRVTLRCHFEEVLIKSTWTTSPDNTFERSRPRKQDVAVSDDIIRIQIGTGLICPQRVARTKLCDLDDRKRSALLWRILLER